MKNNILSIKELNFQVDGKHILKNINLELKKGEIVGLIGPNGAGKSTLLKCLNGINKYDGKIKIKGKCIKEYSDKMLAQNISLMNQDTNIQFPFKCKEIVLMGRYPYIKNGRVLTSKDKNIANKYIDYMNINHLLKKKINDLSGGERQRVLFSKILTQETDIVLLDEPTSNLDIKYQEDIFKFMKKLIKEGKLVITTVHDLRIAMKYCTRLILLKDGEVISSGNCSQVMTEENLFKAYDIEVVVYRNHLTDNLEFCMKEDIQA